MCTDITPTPVLTRACPRSPRAQRGGRAAAAPESDLQTTSAAKACSRGDGAAAASAAAPRGDAAEQEVLPGTDKVARDHGAALDRPGIRAENQKSRINHSSRLQILNIRNNIENCYNK